jgi:hypothetical protein
MTTIEIEMVVCVALRKKDFSVNCKSRGAGSTQKDLGVTASEIDSVEKVKCALPYTFLFVSYF